MIESLRPAAAVAVCLMAAALILLFGNRIHRNLREAITVIAAICAAGLIFSMAPAVAAGHVYEARLWQIAEGIKLGFRTDAAGMVFACIASFLWILTSVYSIGYMRKKSDRLFRGLRGLRRFSPWNRAGGEFDDFFHFLRNADNRDLSTGSAWS